MQTGGDAGVPHDEASKVIVILIDRLGTALPWFRVAHVLVQGFFFGGGNEWEQVQHLRAANRGRELLSGSVLEGVETSTVLESTTERGVYVLSAVYTVLWWINVPRLSDRTGIRLKYSQLSYNPYPRTYLEGVWVT